MANIVVTLLRDEANFLNDWVLHCLAMGFDKIIVFDDMSDVAASRIVAQLPPQISAKVESIRVETEFNGWTAATRDTLFDRAVFQAFSHSKQMYFCNLAVKHFLDLTDWVAFLDVDEFISLGVLRSIGELREAVQRRGFAGIVLTFMMFGHGYNLVPPADNNVCAFIWRADSYFGQGKFFAHVGSLRGVDTPHLPTLLGERLACDALYKPRSEEYDWGYRKPPDLALPHLKHFTVQDVFSNFRRRTRVTIADKSPPGPANPTWISRMEMIAWTSHEVDTELAAWIMLIRSRAGLDITAHARALSAALERVPAAAETGAILDYDYLRERMGADPSVTDAEVIYRFVTQDGADLSMLRFARLPDDFDHDLYRSFNGDLVSLSNRQLEHHYLTWGRREARRYRPDQPPTRR